ncbi:MAG: cell envelope integrity protein CreD [Pseudomonadales bacterium]
MRSTSRTTLRFGLIGVIALAMLIPLAMVGGVTDERQAYFDGALADVARAWGGVQTLAGPFLVIPERHTLKVQQDDGRIVEKAVVRERVYLPATLSVTLDVRHQTRQRAIYDVPVYTAQARFSGSFPAVGAAGTEGRPLLEEARLVVGISHTQAISSASSMSWGDERSEFRAGTGLVWIDSGIQAKAPFAAAGTSTFGFELALKGSQALAFTPVGGSTDVEVTSSWPHPSFDGNYLPERYEIDADGFSAEWQVHELARNLPDSFLVDAAGPELGSSSASIRLFQPVTEYRIVDRAIKYGLLFVSLTFLGFVCFELTLGLRFHPVQYGVVGIALVLFYLALLSLSEHLAFGIAYALATGALCMLVGAYVWGMTRSARVTGWLVGIVLGLYGTLYVLLQLEAFALLVGTAVLFVGLGALMFSTRLLAEEAASA